MRQIRIIIAGALLTLASAASAGTIGMFSIGIEDSVDFFDNFGHLIQSEFNDGTVGDDEAGYEFDISSEGDPDSGTPYLGDTPAADFHLIFNTVVELVEEFFRHEDGLGEVFWTIGVSVAHCRSYSRSGVRSVAGA